MKKLVCNVCQAEYTDEPSIEMAKKMQETWEKDCRDGGIEATGIAPCPNISCSGQLVLKEE